MYQWNAQKGFRLCPDQPNAGNVFVAAETHAALMKAQKEGLQIVADDNGSPVAVEQPASIDDLWGSLRDERNLRLEKSDKFALPDYPHVDAAVRQAWLDYRQALRDLPMKTQDPASPMWPVRSDEQAVD